MFEFLLLIKVFSLGLSIGQKLPNVKPDPKPISDWGEMTVTKVEKR